MASVAAARGTRSAREASKIKKKGKPASRRQTRVVERVAGALEVVRRILRVIMPLGGEGEVAVVAERRCEDLRFAIPCWLLARQECLGTPGRHTFQSTPANRSSTIHQHSLCDTFVTCTRRTQHPQPRQDASTQAMQSAESCSSAHLSAELSAAASSCVGVQVGRSALTSEYKSRNSPMKCRILRLNLHVNENCAVAL